jgi:hypothetical protein
MDLAKSGEELAAMVLTQGYIPLSVSMLRNSPTILIVNTSASESFGWEPRSWTRRPLIRSSTRQKTAMTRRC